MRTHINKNVGALATAAVLVLSGPTAASAADDGAAIETLKVLCTTKGGDAYTTPYAIVRCQQARSNKGFDEERRVCEHELGARFTAVESIYRNNRTTWTCTATSPAV